MKRYVFLVWMALLAGFCTVHAQERMKVIMDNDFAGDPDGLFALAQLVRSTSVDVRAIIGSHLHTNENWTAKGQPSVATAVSNVHELLTRIGKKGICPVVAGSEKPLADTLSAIKNSATDLIISEAMQCTKENPLYLLCGGGLTEIASAWMIRPEIADKIVLVWIGGAEYPGFVTPPGSRGGEYNTTIDICAAQVVFNRSNLKLWQIPRNAYRQCLVSYSVLHSRLTDNSVTRYLLDMLNPYMGPSRRSECYVLGDSPLVLVSALQSNWERDACSSLYTMRSCPTVDDKGSYHFDAERRKIKVFDSLDTYLMFEDMYAKLSLP